MEQKKVAKEDEAEIGAEDKWGWQKRVKEEEDAEGNESGSVMDRWKDKEKRET